MPKVFHCSKCQEEHSRPVGKKCTKSAGESFSSAAQVPVPPSPTNEITASDQILSQLHQIGEKMEAMDRRVQRTEAALEQCSSHVSLLPTTSQGQSQYDTVSHGIDTELASSQSVVPSMSFLKNNESVQHEVEKRLTELKNLNESANKGRVKSQRGGPGEIFVKKSIDWPQHFILIGTHKTRPSYNDLTITQWVSGFVRCMQEERSEHNKTCMLDYLGNIMEDASDFSWDSAKACHAVVLTNMEADRLNWADTDKIDRIQRAHAQRHTSGAQTSGTRSIAKKGKTPYTKNGVICRYFQEGTCKYPTHHKTAGQFYRHACENCDGTHTTKNCNQKNVAKN